eukprot:5018433-Alexandrium_andersonii.AAC.1
MALLATILAWSTGVRLKTMHAGPSHAIQGLKLALSLLTPAGHRDRTHAGHLGADLLTLEGPSHLGHDSVG